MDNRPNPDQLLKRVETEEKLSHRGRLKLFFGASPGVGKTYAMLEAARQRKKEGWDVVVGLVETHGRVETEALLPGFEILPRKIVTYKTVSLQEFDLDAALARRPRLIVVDELAHSNAPGLRHIKRWQDVDELLDAGFDVYTTLNVQHWETLNDVVAQITGVIVKETVPDTFLKQAHELELVDLAPEDLLKRLKAGKVYKADLAGQAADNFFQPGNLIALRELALRHAAERVEAQMQAFKQQNSIAQEWLVGERLLVGIGAGAMSARLLRATSRLANRLRAPWMAVHVATPSEGGGNVTANLRLAEKLGGEAITLTGENISDELLSFAKSHNVSRIVLGKPARPRWKEILFGSVVNEVARQSGPIDLHVISGVGSDVSSRHSYAPSTPTNKAGFFAALLIVIGCSLICWPLSRHFDRVNLVMIYLLGVVWTAYRFGRRISFFASILSVACFDFFFVPPYMTFGVTDTQYLLTFGIMLSVGLLISTITGRLRYQTEILRERAEHMRVLYKLSRDLSETPSIRQMLGTAVHYLEDFYKCPILIFTNGSENKLELSAGDPTPFGWNENEFSVVQWVFDKSQMAGAGSDTLSGARGLYLPLKGSRDTVGVLGIHAVNGKKFAVPDHLQLLETFVSEIAGALESTRMSEEIGRAEMQMELRAMQKSTNHLDLFLSDFLTEERIVMLAPGLAQHEIIRELLARLPLANPAQALQAISAREKAGATRMGELAIPHARIPGLKEIQVCMGVDPKGPTKLWLLFLSPADDPKTHLNFLAHLASIFRNESIIARLLEEKSASVILRELRRCETLLR